MVRPLTISALGAAMILCFAVQTASADDCYPCGADSMGPVAKKLIPQEFRGADFRPACRRHDNCYDTPGSNKRECDRQFLHDLQCSCKYSENPIACRCVARMFYVSVKLGGCNAFKKAQKAASR
jgi:hypothetical protein